MVRPALPFLQVEPHRDKKKTPRAPKGSRKVVACRQTSHAVLRALDNGLLQCRGAGLATFLPAEEDKLVPLSSRNTLVLTSDEGSPSMAMGQWLQYKSKLRILVMRDIFHREWNGASNSINCVGMWGTVLLTTMAFNLPYGLGTGMLGGLRPTRMSSTVRV